MSFLEKAFGLLRISFLLRTSWTGMRLEFKWNQPPASVQGGQTTNSSGGLSLSSFKTHSWLLVLLRSYPVHVSTESPLSPSFLTSGTKRGGQKTSTTAYFLPTLEDRTPSFTCFLRLRVLCRYVWGSGGSGGVLCDSGGSWYRYLVRFRRVPVQIPCEVPEVSGAGSRWGSGGLWCRYLVRF